MTWTRVIGATTFVIVAAMGWACGGDDGPTTVCPADDKSTTTVDESQCKALATVEQGQQSVTTRGCPSCHGADMSGSTSILVRSTVPTTTVLGAAIELYPPNLTPDPTGIAAAKWTDDALALAIRNGIDADSETLCPQMQHFSTMNDYEVYSIVKYLRSLPAVAKKVPRSVCPPTKTKEQQ